MKLQTLANNLKVSIVIITNNIHIPIIPIIPSSFLCNMLWMFVYIDDTGFTPLIKEQTQVEEKKIKKKIER